MRAPIDAPVRVSGRPSGRGRGAPALPRDWLSTWLVLLVASAMGFLAALSVAAALGADTLARGLTQDLKSRATVVLPVAERDEETLSRAVEVISQAPGVRSVRPIGGAEQADLLAPWLGEDRELSDLPLPRLIDVVGVSDRSPPIAEIARRLSEAGIEADVDAHGAYVERLEPAARQIRAFAYGALMIVAAAAGLTVALACTAGLTAQARIVDVLKLVGAQDSYISRIFVRRYQWLAFLGSGGGAAVAILALILSSGAGGGQVVLNEELAPLLPNLRPQGDDWLRFAAIPASFAIIATIAARLSVRRTLRRR
ncbi:MAG: hypothetical protein AAFU68_15560 [Pseudomonadota bacterium]